jgi:ankyrin repeat protein
MSNTNRANLDQAFLRQVTLLRAIEDSQVGIARHLVEAEGVNVNGSVDNTLWPLLVAARVGNLPILRMLVQNGVNVTQGELLEASQAGKPLALQYFIKEHKMNVDAVNQNGQTSLMLAVKNNHFYTAKFLVNGLGANMHVLDNFGNSVLDLAIKTSNDKFISWFQAEEVCRHDSYVDFALVCPKMVTSPNLPGLPRA